VPAALAGDLVDPKLLDIMSAVAAGQLSPEAAARSTRSLAAGYEQVGDFAAVDAWRAGRTGFPEVVMAAGKTPDQLGAILSRQAGAVGAGPAIASRVDPETAAAVGASLPADEAARLTYNAPARLLTLAPATGKKQPRLPGTVVVLSAGMADAGVAEECRAVAEAMGCYAFRLADLAVDGLHRVLHNLPAVRAADVVVVVTGTDGALASVVAGLVEAPVIAVPTSVGYGAALNGLAPLLACLVASSPGVTVVNIDSGFGAAMVAARMLRTAAKLRRVPK